MNFFSVEAFGRLSSERDPNAALKFALTRVFSDGMAGELARLLDPSDRVGAVGGEPGWEIERRSPRPLDPSAYDTWPQGADFRAYVDPVGFELACPETYCDAHTFASHVWVAAAVYGRHHPEDMPLVARLLDLLPKRPAEPLAAAAPSA